MSTIHHAVVADPAATTAPIPSKVALRTVLGYVFAVIGAILFSTKAIVVKLAYGYPVDAETLLALRMGVALPFYLLFGVIALVRRKRAGIPMPNVVRLISALCCGLLGYWLASYTDFLGLLWISATFERLILFTYPLFVVLFGWMFFGSKLYWGILPSFVCSYAGLALVFGSHANDTGANVALGATMIFIAALAFALYQLLAKREIGLMGAELFTAVGMSGASLGALIVFFLTHKTSDLLIGQQILPHVLFLAIGSTIIPSYFLNAALARISAEANGAIGMISPIATIVLAALLLGEHLSLSEIIGTALVVSGVAFFVLSERKKSSAA